MACAMSMGLMAVADVFVPLFYGKEYSKCVSLFYILLPSCVFLAIANVIRTQYLIPHSLDKEYTISLIIGAVVNLCINAMLIPNLQSIGAAIGTLIAEGFVCVYQVICVQKYLPIKDYLKDLVYIVASGIIMMFVVYSLPVFDQYFLTLSYKIVIGFVVFLVFMTIKYREIMKEIVKK